MNRATRICASCHRWELNQATAEQQQAGGAPCSGYENVSAWDDRFCVLYVPAPDLAARRGWVRQFLAAQQQTEGGQQG
jgi:hypothetical protein